MKIDPVLYHLHHQKETEDIPFWSQLADEFGGPNLELGCGTGRLLIPLTLAGHQVYGLDISYQVLSFLKSQLRDNLVDRINIFQSSLDEFHLGGEFSFIFLACNTLSTLHEDVRQKAYGRIFEHLSIGGVFAASIPNPAYLKKLPRSGDSEFEETFTHPSSGNPVQVSSAWERFEKNLVFRWHYDQLLPDGSVMRETMQTQHILTSVEDHLACLKAAKLIPFQLFGDFEGTDFHQDSPYMIILARKESEF